MAAIARDPAAVAEKHFDLAIVGGGIYGACIALEAARRGLSSVTLERADFGSQTSFNSLRIVHGGLRYLRDANPKLMRTMSRERRRWMRIAPHLVHPLPCLIPTYRKLTKSKLTLATALKLNDLMSHDRNRLNHAHGGRARRRRTSADSRHHPTGAGARSTQPPIQHRAIRRAPPLRHPDPPPLGNLSAPLQVKALLEPRVL